MFDVLTATDFRPATRIAVSSSASFDSRDTRSQQSVFLRGSVRANTSFRPVLLEPCLAWLRIPREIGHDMRLDNWLQLMLRYARADLRLHDQLVFLEARLLI